MKNDPLEMLRLYHAELIHIRRDIHAHPELGFEEKRTSQLVADKLAEYGVEVHRGMAKTGVIGVIRGKSASSGRMVGLRADMDCLPMHETGNVAHKSTNAGRMHACGHDGHTTMLLGAARYLAQTRNFDGTAVLVFQPAEEGGGGGQVMVQEGLFEKLPCQEIYALHNWPGLPVGKMQVRPGPMMAATDEVRIKVTGRGGHAALPHLSVDPVVVTAHVITALQTIASRNANPLDSIVVSLCSMQTSQLGAFNVIPGHVELIGTVRTFRPETRELGERRVVRDLVEVGPVPIAAVQLCVGGLPQQEVGNAHVAAGADEQVRVRGATSREVARHRLLSDLGGAHLVLHHALDRRQDVIAPAVAEADVQRHALVLLRQRNRVRNLLLQPLRQRLHVPEHAQLDAVLVQVVGLALDEVAQQPDQQPHFLFRPVPVLGTECVEREVLHAVVGEPLDDATDVLCACPVAGRARQPSLRRPAPVAIHDHCHVPRHAPA